MIRSWRRQATWTLLLLGVLACGARSTAAAPESEVVFSPPSPTLDNPRSPIETRPASTLTLDIIAYDQQGQRIEPSTENPLHIEVSGPRRGAVTTADVRLTSGSQLTFTYDGGFIAAPVTLAAWIDDPGGRRRALGRTQLLPGNLVDCTYGDARHTLRVLCEDGGTEEQCALQAIRRGLTEPRKIE